MMAICMMEMDVLQAVRYKITAGSDMTLITILQQLKHVDRNVEMEY